MSIISRISSIVSAMRVAGSYAVLENNGDIYTITSAVVTELSVDDYVTLNDLDYRVVEIVSPKIFKVTTNGGTAPELGGVWNAKAPYFMYGTRKTIDRDLLELSSGEFAYQKYPLIALRIPSSVRVTNGVVTVDDVNLLFATFTNKQYKMHERYENIIEPVLRPLVAKFLHTIKNTGYFSQLGLDYTYIDRPFYGTEVGGQDNIANVFSDPLDAIELRGLKVKFFEDNCLP